MTGIDTNDSSDCIQNRRATKDECNDPNGVADGRQAVCEEHRLTLQTDVVILINDQVEVGLPPIGSSRSRGTSRGAISWRWRPHLWC